MNIFYLSPCPKQSAKDQCDKHVVKMILESAQMLCTAHRFLDSHEWADEVGLYKMVHKNHPSSIWVRSSVHNYTWLYVHMVALMNEYTNRYAKHHASEKLSFALGQHPKKIPIVDFTDPPQCMPDEYKNENTVTAYRNYYKGEKNDFAKWDYSEQPDWWGE